MRACVRVRVGGTGGGFHSKQGAWMCAEQSAIECAEAGGYVSMHMCGNARAPPRLPARAPTSLTHAHAHSGLEVGVKACSVSM